EAPDPYWLPARGTILPEMTRQRLREQFTWMDKGPSKPCAVFVISHRVTLMRKLASLLILYSAASAQAQDITLKSNTDWLWFIKSEATYLIINNAATGCWTNIQAAKSAVELELRKSGVEIGDDTATAVVLAASSYKAPDFNFCAVSFTFKLI